MATRLLLHGSLFHLFLSSADSYTTDENRHDLWGTPIIQGTSVPRYAVKVKVCITSLVVHKSWIDAGASEEWLMYVTTDGTTPIKLNEMGIPVDMKNANHVINLSHCDQMAVDATKVFNEFPIYSSGMETDEIFTGDERLPRAMTVIRFPKPQSPKKDKKKETKRQSPSRRRFYKRYSDPEEYDEDDEDNKDNEDNEDDNSDNVNSNPRNSKRRPSTRFHRDEEDEGESEEEEEDDEEDDDEEEIKETNQQVQPSTPPKPPMVEFELKGDDGRRSYTLKGNVEWIRVSGLF
jgi:hypothetical protein